MSSGPVDTKCQKGAKTAEKLWRHQTNDFCHRQFRLHEYLTQREQANDPIWEANAERTGCYFFDYSIIKMCWDQFCHLINQLSALLH